MLAGEGKTAKIAGHILGNDVASWAIILMRI